MDHIHQASMAANEAAYPVQNAGAHLEGPTRSLTELLQPHKPIQELRSSAEKLIWVPHTRPATYRERVFSVLVPKLWNSEPDSLTSCHKLSTYTS